MNQGGFYVLFLLITHLECGTGVLTQGLHQCEYIHYTNELGVLLADILSY